MSTTMKNYILFAGNAYGNRRVFVFTSLEEAEDALLELPYFGEDKWTFDQENSYIEEAEPGEEFWKWVEEN